MSDVKKQLESILCFYLSTRRVGHSHAAVHGAANTAALVVVNDSRYEIPWCNTIVRSDLASYRSAGRIVPVVWDNSAIVGLVEDALGEIMRLEKLLEDKTETVEP